MKTQKSPRRREDDVVIVYVWSPRLYLKLGGTSSQLETIPGVRPGAAAPVVHAAPRKRITVLLADDHQMVREGFRRILEREEDIVVVGEAQNGRQAVLHSQRLSPDVVLMDIAMPLLNGLEASRRVIAACPASKVLILSAHRDDAYIRGAVESGAAGFLLKQTSGNVVCRAIRQVHAGKKYFSPPVSRRLRHLNGRSPDRAV